MIFKDGMLVEPKLSVLHKMIEDRSQLIRDGEGGSNDEQIDDLGEKIFAFLSELRDALTVETIVESLTRLGHAPSILYDDNGHFTIGGDGSQNLPSFEDGWETRETYFQGTWHVKPGGWKKTIREALYDYLDNM